MLKKPYICLAAFILITISARAQYYYYDSRYYDSDIIWEIGTSGGMMVGMTDVGSKKGFMPNMKSMRGNMSVYAALMYQGLVGVRLEATWGQIAGADSNGTQKIRNLSYRTPIREVAIVAELHPLMINYREQPPVLSPYIAAGMGWFSFNPQANLGGSWVDLQPLRTEGQGIPQAMEYGADARPYRLSQANIVSGLGVRFEASPLFIIRAELLYRKTFTDYLDDASRFYVKPEWFDENLSPAYAALAKQLYDRTEEKYPGESYPFLGVRGDPKTKDGYFTVNLKLAVALGRRKM